MMLGLALLMLLISVGVAFAEPISATVAATTAVASTATVATGTAAATAAVTTAAATAGAVVTTGAVTTFLINAAIATGISLGLSLLSKALAGKPKAGETLSGVETNVQFGGDIARQIAIGTCGAKGHLVYHNSPPSIDHKISISRFTC